MKGKLVVFEGPEGCGKSTQAQLAHVYLKESGVKAIMLREPGGNIISEKIRSIILDTAHTKMSAKTELLLYIASRAQIIEEKLKPLLKEGYTVILDRFGLSTIVYQGYARGLDKKFIKSLNTYVSEGVKVDLTVLYDVSLEEAKKRLSKRSKSDRIDQENDAFHKKVRAGYLAEVKATPNAVTIKTDGKNPNSIFEETINVLKKKRIA
jgi:dTMP kinase